MEQRTIDWKLKHTWHARCRGAGASGAEDGAVAAAPSTAASQPSGELPLMKAEESADAEADVLMSDVAALARSGQSADPVANLESALRPIERYAVRFLEEVRFCIPP